MDSVVVDLLLNCLAHGLPQRSDLMMARPGLDGDELVGVEPSWSMAIERVV
jgi:hypothetical protein